MEAVLAYPFETSDANELSVPKGKTIRVVNLEEDPHWCKAEYDGKEGLVPKNYIQMKDYSWYAGSISRAEAENELLKDEHTNGAYLVRRSESSPGDFSLSVKYNKSVQHFKVLRDGAGKYFLWIVKFDSLNQLVHYHKTTSVSRGIPNLTLKTPVNINGTPAVTTSAASGETSTPQSSAEIVVAIYDFTPDQNCKDELPMKKDDQIVVLSKTDPNWWTGRNLRSKNEGLFPANHVKQVK